MPILEALAEVVAEIASSAFEFVAHAAVSSSARRRTEKEQRSHVGTRLRLSSVVLAIAIVGLTMFGGGGFAFLASRGESSALGIAVVLVGLNLPFVWLLAEYVVVRHDVSDQGVAFRLIGRRGSFLWDEVVRVRYVPWAGWFVVGLASGAIVRVSGLLIGLPEFASRVLERAAAAEIDEPTKAGLRSLAAGVLPPVL